MNIVLALSVLFPFSLLLLVLLRIVQRSETQALLIARSEPQ